MDDRDRRDETAPPAFDPVNADSVDPQSGADVNPVGESQPQVDDTLVTDEGSGAAPDPDGSDSEAQRMSRGDVGPDGDPLEPVAREDDTDPIRGTPDPRQV